MGETGDGVQRRRDKRLRKGVLSAMFAYFERRACASAFCPTGAASALAGRPLCAQKLHLLFPFLYEIMNV